MPKTTRALYFSVQAVSLLMLVFLKKLVVELLRQVVYDIMSTPIRLPLAQTGVEAVITNYFLFCCCSCLL